MKKLLTKLFKQTKFDVEVRILPSRKQILTRDVSVIEKMLTEYREQNIYFGVYTRSGGGTKEHVREATCVFADMDFKGYEHGQTEADSRLKNFKIKPSAVVNSGNGYHVYWILEAPVDAQENILALESTMKGIAAALASDPSVAEIARILRIPGGYNHKCLPPKKVELIELNENVYTLTDFSEYQTTQKAASKPTVKNKETIEQLKHRCAFVKYCAENADSLIEPLWYPLISNVARLTGGPDICHDLSKGYSQYSKKETDTKILHALNAAGPFTCSSIKEIMDLQLGFNCGEKCGVKAPVIALRGNVVKNAIEIKSGSEIMTESLAYVDNRVLNKGKLSGIPTGLRELDKIMDGFQPGQLVCLAARPSVGKSALMLKFITSAAQICPVGSISLEMSTVDKGIRLLAAETGVTINNYRRGHLVKDDFARTYKAASNFAELPTYFAYAAYSDTDMENYITHMAETLGCRIIFIDHLHLMHTKESSNNRSLELAKITKTAKRLAMKYSICVVMLCQLNREAERAERAPKMSDLRDSGAIEQDADVVLMLHVVSRENEYPQKIQLAIEKGRTCGKGRMLLSYEGMITKFGEEMQDD